jgi:hypothetical protein
MESKIDNRVVKGMIFAGCSFTWGQGLYYYSNLPTLKEPLPDHYDSSLVKSSHIEFMKTIRYPRLVASHFKTFEYVHPSNGGANHSAVEWWKDCFNNRQREAWREGHVVPKIEYEEISHLVFQFTQWQRNNFIIEHKGQRHDVPYHAACQEPVDKVFAEWLIDQNQTLDSWTKNYIQSNIDEVKDFLVNCEQHGIKTLVFTWPDELLEYIEKDPWLVERLIKFDYDGKNYDSIEKLMSRTFMHGPLYNPELTIKWDTENFKETPKDHHPSKKCHQVMADNIIKHIERLG